MKIEIKNQDQVKALLNGENELILFYNNEYVEGDHICIYPDQVPVYLNNIIYDLYQRRNIPIFYSLWK